MRFVQSKNEMYCFVVYIHTYMNLVRTVIHSSVYEIEYTEQRYMGQQVAEKKRTRKIHTISCQTIIESKYRDPHGKAEKVGIIVRMDGAYQTPLSI